MSAEGQPPEPAGPREARIGDVVQRAAGVVAARRRGDDAGAETLLASFTDDAEKALAFYALTEVTLSLLAQVTDTSVADCAARLAVAVATGDPNPA